MGLIVPSQYSTRFSSWVLLVSLNVKANFHLGIVDSSVNYLNVMLIQHSFPSISCLSFHINPNFPKSRNYSSSYC
ncbi:hypothetical protein L1887_17183 [Cichorium endivia]|nr:hypothetical protein L1887_17183 [Cichorium endivia]